MGWTLDKALLFGRDGKASSTLIGKRNSQLSPAENLLLSPVPKPDKWAKQANFNLCLIMVSGECLGERGQQRSLSW